MFKYRARPLLLRRLAALDHDARGSAVGSFDSPENLIEKLIGIVSHEGSRYRRSFSARDRLLAIELLGFTRSATSLDFLIRLYTPHISRERRSKGAYQYDEQPIDMLWEVDRYSYRSAPHPLASLLDYDVRVTHSGDNCIGPPTLLADIEHERSQILGQSDAHQVMRLALCSLCHDLAAIRHTSCIIQFISDASPSVTAAACSTLQELVRHSELHAKDLSDALDRLIPIVLDIASGSYLQALATLRAITPDIAEVLTSVAEDRPDSLAEFRQIYVARPDHFRSLHSLLENTHSWRARARAVTLIDYVRGGIEL